MKFGVVIFPGSNCDQDLIHIVRNGLKQEVVELWHKDHTLQGCDFVFLPGGFSYGDYLRSGAIARFSPIMQEVLEFADKGGLVMGICNGFQILTEAKLLPGALLHNTNNKFICKNVRLKVETDDSVITTKFKIGDQVTVPIAHGEGNFHCDATTLQSMKDNNQILFRYCDEMGAITPESNPNGSLENIAGICNKGRNVYGMMPHPERAADAILGNTDGRKILESILNAVIA